MDRVITFLPSIVGLTCIALATFFYCKWIIKHYGEEFKSVAWHEEHQLKVTLTVGMPLMSLYAPAVEELIFRAPLIIAFSSVTTNAWYGICASSLTFSLVHLFGKKVLMPEILAARQGGEHQTDDVIVEADRIHAQLGKAVLRRKVWHAACTFIIGIFISYFAVASQSLWVAFGIHAAWNLIMPFVVQVIIIFGLVAFSGLRYLVVTRKK